TTETFSPENATVHDTGAGAKVDLPYEAQSMTWIGFDLQEFQATAETSTTFEVHHYLVITATLELDRLDNPVTAPTDAATESTGESDRAEDSEKAEDGPSEDSSKSEDSADETAVEE